ncbi:MAG: RNA methyltransferase, partial [Victivallaceae bacterium]|nr:RNA methyltransferase [Victivallaceae bacterium]
MEEELTRREESLLRVLRTRHGRKKEQLCLCEGIRAVGELAQRRPELMRFVVLTSNAQNELIQRGVKLTCRTIEVSETRAAALGGTVSPQGVLAVAELPPEPGEDDVPGDQFILLLDGLGDPGNFGTVVRGARAAGLTELWYTAGSIDPYGDKAVRSALGAQFAMKLRGFADVAAAAEFGQSFGFDRVYITDPHDGASCFVEPRLFDRSIVVIGGEANGARPYEAAHGVRIPMPGDYESLNAA